MNDEELEELGKLQPDPDERTSILNRMSDNETFETLMQDLVCVLTGHTPTQMLLAIASLLLLVKVEEDSDEDVMLSKEIAKTIFDNLVQDKGVPPRVMTLIASNLLARVVTKLEYVQSIHSLLGGENDRSDTEISDLPP